MKLNVNGGEAQALRGSRKLLSRRGVCVLMMHVQKLLRGWDPSDEEFAPEMAGLLQLGATLTSFLLHYKLVSIRIAYTTQHFCCL